MNPRRASQVESRKSHLFGPSAPYGQNVLPPTSQNGTIVSDNMSACSAINALGPPQELWRGLHSDPPMDNVSSGCTVIGQSSMPDRRHFIRGEYAENSHSNFQGMVLQGVDPRYGWDNVGKIGPPRPRGVRVYDDHVCGGPSHVMASSLEQAPVDTFDRVRVASEGYSRFDSQQVAQIFSGIAVENAATRQTLLQTEDSRRMAGILKEGPPDALDRALYLAFDGTVRNVDETALAGENMVFGSRQVAPVINGVPLTPDIRTRRPFVANRNSDLVARAITGVPANDDLSRRALEPTQQSDLVRKVFVGTPMIENGVRRRDWLPNENSDQMSQVLRQREIFHNRCIGAGRQAAVGPLQAAGSMMASPRIGTGSSNLPLQHGYKHSLA